MSVDRRYALLQHNHDDVYANVADAETISGDWTFLGEVSFGDPGSEAGSIQVNGAHIYLYETDAADTGDYGMLQVGGNIVDLFGYDNSAAKTRGIINGNITTGEVNVNVSSAGGPTYVGNLNTSSHTYIYGSGSSAVSIIANDSTSAALRLFRNGGANLVAYWYGTDTEHGLLGKDGNWDLNIVQSTNAMSIYGPAYIAPSSSSNAYLYFAAAGYIGYNSSSSYTALRLGGSKGNYGGWYDDYSGVACMFDSAGNGGFFDEGASVWMMYWGASNTCWGFGGTTTSSSYEIYVTGSSYASGSWSTSDARKKDRVENIPDALDVVSSLRGVRYHWREDADVGQDSSKRHFGVIAQELEAVVPEVVNYAADVDTYAVDYNGLVGLLIEAVKELREEVKELKNGRS